MWFWSNITSWSWLHLHLGKHKGFCLLITIYALYMNIIYTYIYISIWSYRYKYQRVSWNCCDSFLKNHLFKDTLDVLQSRESCLKMTKLVLKDLMHQAITLPFHLLDNLMPIYTYMLRTYDICIWGRILSNHLPATSTTSNSSYYKCYLPPGFPNGRKRETMPAWPPPDLDGSILKLSISILELKEHLLQDPMGFHCVFFWVWTYRFVFLIR